MYSASADRLYLRRCCRDRMQMGYATMWTGLKIYSSLSILALYHDNLHPTNIIYICNSGLMTIFGTCYKFSSRVHRFFMTRPMVANSATGFVTFMIGDILSQSVTQNKNNGYISTNTIDIMRSMRTGCLGVFMNGVTLHYWYRALDRMFGVSMKSMKNVIMKCAADQLVYAPFSIVAFFSYAAVNKGGSVDDMKSRFSQKFGESFTGTWAADCSVWPLINVVSFSLVPVHVRPTFIGFAQVGWQSYLSYVGYRDGTELVRDTEDSSLPVGEVSGHILSLDMETSERSQAQSVSP